VGNRGSASKSYRMAHSRAATKARHGGAAYPAAALRRQRGFDPTVGLVRKRLRSRGGCVRSVAMRTRRPGARTSRGSPVTLLPAAPRPREVSRTARCSPHRGKTRRQRIHRRRSLSTGVAIATPSPPPATLSPPPASFKIPLNRASARQVERGAD
jgi:hypothetical protein